MAFDLLIYYGAVNYFLNSLFKIIIDSEEIAEMYREVPCILYPISPRAIILHNYSTVSKPENWLRYSLHHLFVFHQLYISSLICMCRELHAVLSRVTSCIHCHSILNIPLPQAPSYYLFIFTPILLTTPSL